MLWWWNCVLLYSVASVNWCLRTFFCSDLLRSYHNISMRLQSGLWLCHCSTVILCLFRPFCFGFAAVLGITVLLHDYTWAKLRLSDRWQSTLKFFVDSMTARYPDPHQIITPPPWCLTAGMRCRALFGLICPRTLLQKFYQEQSFNWLVLKRQLLNAVGKICLITFSFQMAKATLSDSK